MSTLRLDNTINLVSSFLESDESYLEKQAIAYKDKVISGISPMFEKTFLGHIFAVWNSPLK